ncbi:MAG: peptide chain release factor N(5)-glutamine methyltransferase [Candidatus Auribacterota bacterium]|jgi:release factor glutamine methyltransferase|nr:peptide chain release factor N(5)-glutamine methyltransferase [Candidatus Auribacterota bacterium]
MDQEWTILSIIKWGDEYLHRHEIEFSRLTIELMLAKIYNCKRIDLYLQYDQPLTPDELKNLKQMVKERIKGRPLQYILGEVDFFDTNLLVCEGVLIPRPETELLVEAIVADIDTYKTENCPVILDLGTGSGNISIAVAKKCDSCKIFACDISSKALDIAKENAVRNNVADKINFFKADILHDWNRKTKTEFDYIVSNPPYVSLKDKRELSREVLDFEPHEALFSGERGTEFYERIIDYFSSWLKPDGAMFFEIGINQKQPVLQFLQEKGFYDISMIDDLKRIPRVVRARKKQRKKG